MANWLERLKHDALNKEEECVRAREAGYLMDKEAIDAKSSEIRTIFGIDNGGLK